MLSREKLKPLSAVSKWYEDTPKSKRIPFTAPCIPHAFVKVDRFEKHPCLRVNLLSFFKGLSIVIASWSLSRENNLPLGPRLLRISVECPPEPNVAST